MLIEAVFKREKAPHFKQYAKVPLWGPDSAVALFGEELTNSPEEITRVVYLMADWKYLCHRDIAVGTPSEVSCHPREVLKYALLCNAEGFFVMHNHTHGNCIPSNADVWIANRLYQAAMIHGINMLESIVVCKDDDGKIQHCGIMGKGLIDKAALHLIPAPTHPHGPAMPMESMEGLPLNPGVKSLEDLMNGLLGLKGPPKRPDDTPDIPDCLPPEVL